MRKHIVPYVHEHIVPYVHEKVGKKAKIGSIDRNTFCDYYIWRKKRTATVQDVTDRNEQTTIGAIFKKAAIDGYTNFETLNFSEIKIREVVRNLRRFLGYWKQEDYWTLNDAENDLLTMRASIVSGLGDLG